MSRLKHSLQFEQLETRCLLNGTLYEPLMIADQAPAGNSAQSEMQLRGQHPIVAADPASDTVSPCPSVAQSSNGTPSSVSETQAAAEALPCASISSVPVVAPVRTPEPIYDAPVVSVVLYESAQVTPPAVSTSSLQVQSVISENVTIVLRPNFQLSYETSIKIAIPEPPPIQMDRLDSAPRVRLALLQDASLSLPSATQTPKETSSVPQANTANISLAQAGKELPQPAKDSAANPVLSRDQSTTAVVTIQNKVTGDRIVPTQSDSAGAPRFAVTPAVLREAAPFLAFAHQIPEQGQTATIVSGRQSLSAAMDVPASESSTALAGSVFQAASLPPTPLWTNMLPPLDVGALDRSVQDFFEHLEQFGLKLSGGQVDLLFSSGLVAVGAALVCELARRKVQKPAPILALNRETSIPYSSYP